MSLTLKNITKSFGEKTLFRDFSYSFSESGIYAVCGDSGVGKTTLLRIIAGLDKDYSGEISGGKYTVSFAFQEYRLFPNLTAIKNVSEASIGNSCEQSLEQARTLLRKLKFSDKDMQLYPSELSGGMKQRVAIARAILRESDVLILDEATKELDSDLVETVLELIKAESERRLVIIVSHDSSDAKRLCATEISI